MTTYKSPIVVGIFQDEIHAKEAVDSLRAAGFRYDQVGVAIQSSQHATPDLQNDLMNLGVPEEQANYYDREYQAGHIVISIRPDGREDEAQDILNGNGAYNYETRSTTSPNGETPSPTDTTQDAISSTTNPDAQPEATSQPAEAENIQANEAEQTEP